MGADAVCSEAYQMDKCLPEVLCLCVLIMFLIGKLPMVLQHMQHALIIDVQPGAHVLLWQ